MSINIYEDYAIKYTSKSVTLSEENETKYDNLFNNEEHEHLLVINGADLLKLIVSKITDNYFSECSIIGKEIHFEIFNYNNGENESICIEILGSGIHENRGDKQWQQKEEVQ